MVPLLPLVLLAAPAADTPRPSDLTARADAYMAAHVEINEFAGVVLVARDGRPLFRKGYGLANRDHDVPNTPATKFRIASVTKQFTAAAVLLLEQQGKLKASDPVGRHLPDVPRAWADVTLLQLLSHTGGVPEYTGPAALAAGGFGRDYRPDQVIGLVKDRPLRSAPGEKWAYSNTGYVLLGMVIEKVSGKDYATFMKESIFDPLGLADTGVERPQQVLRRRATGHARLRGEPVAPYMSMSWPHAAGAMYSTVDDLVKWDRALAGDRLLGPAARKAMVTPVKDDYACGIWVETLFGRPMHRHSGTLPGFQSYLLRLPEDGLCVVVLSNDWNGPPAADPTYRPMAGVARDLAAIALGEKYDRPRHQAPHPRRAFAGG